MARSIIDQSAAGWSNVGQPAAVSLTGALVLSFSSHNCNVLKLDPGGAHRDVTLWPEADAKGMLVTIVNGADAAENLVVKDDDGNTIGTVNQNELGVFHCDGSAWTLFYVQTIALS